jgi:hypothetical protein
VNREQTAEENIRYLRQEDEYEGRENSIIGSVIIYILHIVIY